MNPTSTKGMTDELGEFFFLWDLCAVIRREWIGVENQSEMGFSEDYTIF